MEQRARGTMQVWSEPFTPLRASPYFGHHIPGFASSPWMYAVAFDVVLLISLFVLGRGFWDKLHSLFKHNAYVVIPHKQPSDGKSE